MKNILKYFIAFLAIGLVWSCSDDDELVTLNPDIQNSTSLSIDQSGEIILDRENPDETIMNLSWGEPDFGFNAVPTYLIHVSDNAGNAHEISNGSALTYSFTNQSLNTILTGLDLAPDVPAEVNFQMFARVGQEIVYSSEITTLTITPYASILDLSTTWGIVGSSTPNGWDGPDVPFFQTNEEGVYVAYTDLIVGEIKFRENNAWDVNYGDDGMDGTLEPGSANITIDEAGSYKVTLDLNNLTYTLETFYFGIVGDATVNGWDGPDVKLEFDQYSNTFKTVTTFTAGEMKFRMNNDWATNYGDTGLDGTLEAGGDNIPVDAGHYIVTVDLENMTYSLESIENNWGIVGDATPNGWDGPDFQLQKDWSQPDSDVWVANNVTLTTGEMKFRANNTWDLNYGDDGADGTLEQGGANIAVEAGTYDIVFDLAGGTYSID